jgi:hypothetical protein
MALSTDLHRHLLVPNSQALPCVDLAQRVPSHGRLEVCRILKGIVAWEACILKRSEKRRLRAFARRACSFCPGERLPPCYWKHFGYIIERRKARYGSLIRV